MPVSLEGIRIKLHRAERRARDLNALVAPVIQATKDSITRENDGDKTKLVYRVPHVPRADPDWSAIVGDCLYNLRSAWDHLAWQLVELDEGVPCDKTQFPIYEDRLNANGNPRVIDIKPGIRRGDIREALINFQPFQNPDRWKHRLWVVNELCNRDKHRLLLTMAGVLDVDANHPWWGLPPGVPSPLFWFNLLPLKDNDPIAKFDFKGASAPPDFDPNISLAITLNEGPIAHWARIQPIGTLLTGLRQLLTFDMDWKFIEPFFPSEPALWRSFPNTIT